MSAPGDAAGLALSPATAASARLAAGSHEPALLDRTYEGIIFDWDGTAVPDRAADATGVRQRIEALCAAGVHIFVISGTHVGNVDGQLKARPTGPGQLHLCLNRGSEIFRVDGGEPMLVARMEPPAIEDAALDRAADLCVARLADVGLKTEIVSSRLNRRKIDLIPEPAWVDPPKAIIDRLLEAVLARIHASGFAGLGEVAAVAIQAARDAGLPGAKVTSDVKHIEIGLTDKGDSAQWAFETLADLGIGPGLVLIAGDEFGPIGGLVGSDAMMLIPEAARATVVSVGLEPGGAPPGVIHRGDGPDGFMTILDEQLARRLARRVPAVDDDPRWTLVIEGDDPRMGRVHESLLTIGDGRFGVRGAKEDGGRGTESLMLCNALYDAADGQERLLQAPLWMRLDVRRRLGAERRILDMRTGILYRSADDGRYRSMRLASMARQGTMLLRAEGPAARLGDGDVFEGSASGTTERGSVPAASWARSRSVLGGGIAGVGSQHRNRLNGIHVIERLAVYDADPLVQPPLDELLERLRVVKRAGFSQLLAEHRAAWAKRWSDAEVAIHGDPDTELAVRFALFHLLSAVDNEGEAAVGARGLSGPAYSGHVFWDSDVFMLPVLAAVHAPAARAMLEYRLRRLGAARAAAAARRRAGARFPWESAHEGNDVTPHLVRMPDGAVIPIRTGEHEEHITADVAWAADHYQEWTGGDFLAGPGRPLLVETARYWASRVRTDRAGIGHIYGVTGPDEYHEVVDDNAFTNVMARWNLRRAAALESGPGGSVSPDEIEEWLAVAARLHDGYDETTGVYEQFEGFRGLEPLIIADQAQRPVAADVLLGRTRVAGAQVIKQADVLMMHHLVPEEVAPGSLEPNLAFYEPRCAHGSSLSPAIHAALLARAGQPDRALDLFRIACRLDLDDLTGTTAGGLHMANLGGVWQALTFGFAGVRPVRGRLRIDPRLPAAWDAVEIRFRFRGHRVSLRVAEDEIAIRANGVLAVELGDGTVFDVAAGTTRLERRAGVWRQL